MDDLIWLYVQEARLARERMRSLKKSTPGLTLVYHKLKLISMAWMEAARTVKAYAG